MADTPAAVPGDTDDLSAFETLFSGKAVAPKEEVDTTEEVDNAEELEGQDDEVDETEVPADDEGAGDEPEDDEAAAEETPKPKKNRVQERIDELTAKNHEIERARELDRQEFERRLRELEAQKQEPQKAEPPVKVPVATGPTPDDKNADGTEKYPLGEVDPSFIRDLTRFTIYQESERARIEGEERARAAQMQQAQTQLQTEFRTRAEAVKADLPDFDNNVKVLQGAFASVDPGYGDYLASTIMSMDHGPEVLYYLSQNLPEARQILESGAVKATIALGRLEAKIADKASSAKPPPKKVTQAKEPPKPARGTGGRFVAADTDDLEAFESQFYAKKR